MDARSRGGVAGAIDSWGRFGRGGKVPSESYREVSVMMLTAPQDAQPSSCEAAPEGRSEAHSRRASRSRRQGERILKSRRA
jgi:hypothetical protein